MIPRDLRLTFRPMAVLSPSSVRPKSVTGPSWVRHRPFVFSSSARRPSIALFRRYR